jgi:hypothetical protein
MSQSVATRAAESWPGVSGKKAQSIIRDFLGFIGPRNRPAPGKLAPAGLVLRHTSSKEGL